MFDCILFATRESEVHHLLELMAAGRTYNLLLQVAEGSLDGLYLVHSGFIHGHQLAVYSALRGLVELH